MPIEIAKNWPVCISWLIFIGFALSIYARVSKYIYIQIYLSRHMYVKVYKT